MDKKQAALEKIAEEIYNCTECKKDTIGIAVVGEGNANADVMFIGEAPGKTEAKTGRPFIGRSGKLLRSLIGDSGLKEDEVYITSPVKYLPQRGTPNPKEIAHGKMHLDKQLAIIEPKIIVLLGSVAVQGVLGEKIAVMQRHGEVIERNGRKYFLTIHPAAALRFAKFRPVIKDDFKKLREIIQ